MNWILNEFTLPVIETHGLIKTYKGVEALKALDLQVQKNSICGFLGPNGAGKTTTIKLLLGLSDQPEAVRLCSARTFKRKTIKSAVRLDTWLKTHATMII